MAAGGGGLLSVSFESGWSDLSLACFATRVAGLMDPGHSLDEAWLKSGIEDRRGKVHGA